MLSLSDHLCQFDRLISMPTSTRKQRRLIRYISGQEGALLIIPLNHQEETVLDVTESVPRLAEATRCTFKDGKQHKKTILTDIIATFSGNKCSFPQRTNIFFIKHQNCIIPAFYFLHVSFIFHVQKRMPAAFYLNNQELPSWLEHWGHSHDTPTPINNPSNASLLDSFYFSHLFYILT